MSGFLSNMGAKNICLTLHNQRLEKPFVDHLEGLGSRPSDVGFRMWFLALTVLSDIFKNLGGVKRTDAVLCHWHNSDKRNNES